MFLKSQCVLSDMDFHMTPASATDEERQAK
jgi:hypothetical protein